MTLDVSEDEENVGLIISFNDTNITNNSFRQLLSKAEVSGKEYSKLRRRISKIAV